MQGRRFLYKHLETVLEALQSVRVTATTDDRGLIQEFEDSKKQALSAAGGDREEGRAIRKVYETVRVNLEQTTRIDGTTAPLDERIDAIVQVLLQRRQLLLSSKPTLTQEAGAQ